MKFLITFILFFSLSLSSYAQNESPGGFTNKAEAKNVTQGSLMQGKWIEYLDADGNILPGKDSAAYYRLIVYKDNMAMGTARIYNINNEKLYMEFNYLNGQKNGMYKEYYESGQLMEEANYRNDTLIGSAKDYYESGALKLPM
jgi:antitoxin component YwqK of YwqJK toxin-antitoxin module